MKNIRHILLFAAALLGFAILCATPALADADKPILVSMGDSFAGGEGLEPYYGQDDPYKYWNQDWVAHRSTRSWGSRLTVGGYAASSLKANPINPSYDAVKDQEYVYYNDLGWTEGTWFNVTWSGASIRNIDGGNGAVSADLWYTINKTDANLGNISYYAGSGPQIKVIDYINQTYGKNSVDYITTLVGGMDLNFGGFIVTSAINEVVNGEPLDISGGFQSAIEQLLKAGTSVSITQDIDALTEQINIGKRAFLEEVDGAPTVRDRYIRMLNNLRNAAGPQANIIVVGYPTFFSGSLPNVIITQEEMTLCDDFITWIDEQMQALVNELKAQGFENLYYVSLIDIFEGHGVGTLRTYIENIVPYAREEELDDNSIISSTTFHPNERGTQAIADAVQAIINKIESHTSGWVYENGAWYFYNDDGTCRTSAWAKSGNAWYYLGADGKMMANSWVKSGGAWYYLGSDGKMLTNSWVKSGSAWYYLGADGKVMANAWVKSGGAWYYLGSDGKLVANSWVKSGSAWYYLGSDGKLMVNSWISYNGKWYYVNASGNPVSNTWIRYGNAYYYFNGSGVCTRKVAA